MGAANLGPARLSAVSIPLNLRKVSLILRGLFHDSAWITEIIPLILREARTLILRG